MGNPSRNWSQSQTYQLILHEDARGPGRTIEFEASGAEAALYVAQQQCRGREAELLQEGRSLGRLKCNKGGYWVISPPPAPAHG